MCVLGNGAVFGFLAYCGWVDVKEKSLSVVTLLWFTGVATVLTVLCKEVEIGERAVGLLLGLLFWIVSKVTKEAIGYGDSWIITLLGMYLGGRRLFQILLIATLGAAGVFLFTICRGRFHRKDTLPFLPFLTFAYVGVWFLEI